MHTEAFRQKSIDTYVLHTEALTQSFLYTEKLREAFTQGNSHTATCLEEPTHTDAYRDACTQSRFYTQKLLDRKALTHMFYTQKL